MDKKKSRLRRALRTRKKIEVLQKHRLSVHRSSKHIYAQVLTPCGGKVLASASTLDKALRSEIKYSGNKEAAEKVGALLAKRAVAAGIKAVAFDRSGFMFHGRIKALADAAREAGIEF